jgi:hypothetical protein
MIAFEQLIKAHRRSPPAAPTITRRWGNGSYAQIDNASKIFPLPDVNFAISESN